MKKKRGHKAILKHHWKKIRWGMSKLFNMWEKKHSKHATIKNIAAERKVFRKLKKESDWAFGKLKKDFLKKRMPEVIFDDLKNLRYRLGECSWKIKELERARKALRMKKKTAA